VTDGLTGIAEGNSQKTEGCGIVKVSTISNIGTSDLRTQSEKTGGRPGLLDRSKTAKVWRMMLDKRMS